MKNLKYPILYFIPLALLTLSLIILPSLITKEEKQDIRSKAAGNTLTVCQEGCQYSGTGGLQQAVDAASDGDIINVSGTLSGSSTMSPFPGRMNVKSCFVDLKGKSLTLKGGTFFGEGHDKGAHTDGDPLYHRAGICSKGGTVVIDGIHVKEFEGGGMQFFDTKLILKNSTIDGNDHGGIFLFNTSVIAVNNQIAANIGFIPFGNSSIKAYNNNFFYSKAIVAAASCKDDVPPTDFVNNIVVETELTIGIGGLSTPCPEKVSQFKDRRIAYNLIWKEGRNCYPHEYCEDFVGKVFADPLFAEPVVDPRGIAPWSNFAFKEGSPAVGAGDPNIPGPRNLGVSGGPCVDGNSPSCESFISQQLSQLVPPATPTSAIPIIDYPAPDGQIPTQPPDVGIQFPTRSPQPPGTYQPPITYYLPPTIPNFQPPAQIPAPKPTSSPIINIEKTKETINKSVETVKSGWDNFLKTLIRLSQIILP